MTYLLHFCCSKTHSPEYLWLSGELTLPENEQVVQLEQFLMEHNTTEDKEFGLEALRAIMDGYFVDFEEKIIPELQGKAKCIYDKLNQTSTSFVDAIRKFDGDFPVSHLKFTMTDLPNTTRAITLPPSNYIIEIQLNNDLSQSGVFYRPNLLTAKTIIHEVIHAEMWRKVLSIINNGGDAGGLTVEQWKIKLENGDYPGIYDYYSRFGLNEFQHPLMATHYRETIADVLQELDDYGHSRQFYLDLAWEGLRKSDITTWSSLSPEEQNRINKVFSDYISNNTYQKCINIR